MAAYKKQLRFFMGLQVVVEHVSDEMHILHNQNAFRSSLIHDCIERRQGLDRGGLPLRRRRRAPRQAR